MLMLSLLLWCLVNAKRFSQVARSLARLPSQVARKTAADISREIQRSMDASKDPEGTAWQPKRGGGATQLKKSGRGRASIKVTPTTGAGLKITVGVKYMIYHQFGGKSHLRGHKKHPDFGRDADRGGNRQHPPKRSFLPFEKLPDRWGAIIVVNIEGAAKALLK